MHSPSDWWAQKKEILLNITTPTPFYVYSEEVILGQIEKLKSIGGVSSIFYAIKANSNADILKILCEAGFGFECVSPGELDFIISLFPKLPRTKILFTPNFAPKEEFQYAFSLGVHVNVDNIFPLQKWPEVFKEKPVLLRIDPGTGRGHHEKVKTAGINSKFGIALADIPTAAACIKACQATVIGLHAHVGSGILKDTGNWHEVATCLHGLKSVFPEVKFLNLGGGLGVVQNPSTDTPLDISIVSSSIAEFHASHPDVELWLEPGRFLVAESGVLLAKVTQVKHKDNTKRFVGVNTGFNSLIRPVLYGSYHHAVNLTRLGAPLVWNVDLVGNICESGDIFGSSRDFPESDENDIILIATVGAYGRSMASEYNMRRLPPEIILRKADYQ